MNNDKRRVYNRDFKITVSQAKLSLNELHYGESCEEKRAWGLKKKRKKAKKKKKKRHSSLHS